MKKKKICPVCKTKEFLYLETVDDGCFILECQKCHWVSSLQKHYSDLGGIPTIQQLKKDWY